MENTFEGLVQCELERYERESPVVYDECGGEDDFRSADELARSGFKNYTFDMGTFLKEYLFESDDFRELIKQLVQNY